MNKLKLKQVIEKYGYQTTASQYEILEKITGVDRDTCKQICSLQRDIRQLLPSDEVATKKAENWKLPSYLRNLDNQTQLKV